MDLTPQKTTTGGLSDKSWVYGDHGLDVMQSETLDLTKFTAETHYPDGSIRSGTVLARDTGTGLLVPYDTANSTDADYDTAIGHLFEDTKVNAGSTKAGCAVYWHGSVVEANLPANHGLDAAAKADLVNIRYR